MNEEEFLIKIKEDRYLIKTPKLKGLGVLKLDVYSENNFLCSLKPRLTTEKKIKWVTEPEKLRQLLRRRKIEKIGKAIERYYEELTM